MVAALLLGKGDFGKSICTAVNFGQDTDCTGATVGAILGIMNPDSISAHWLEPIGRTLVVSPEISGITPPPTLDEFTDLVIALKEKVFLSEEADASVDLSRFRIPFRKRGRAARARTPFGWRIAVRNGRSSSEKTGDRISGKSQFLVSTAGADSVYGPRRNGQES